MHQMRPGPLHCRSHSSSRPSSPHLDCTELALVPFLEFPSLIRRAKDGLRVDTERNLPRPDRFCKTSSFLSSFLILDFLCLLKCFLSFVFWGRTDLPAASCCFWMVATCFWTFVDWVSYCSIGSELFWRVYRSGGEGSSHFETKCLSYEWMISVRATLPLQFLVLKSRLSRL